MGLGIFVYTATLLLFSCSSTDLDVQEPSNIQKILLDAVKRGNVVKVSLGLCVLPNSIPTLPQIFVKKKFYSCIYLTDILCWTKFSYPLIPNPGDGKP